MAPADLTPEREPQWLSRRTFVAAGAVAGAAALVQFDPVGAASVRLVRSRTVASLHLKTFLAVRGGTFTAWHDGRKSTLRLAAVKHLTQAGTSSTQECFALRFRLLSGPALAQGTFRFSNARIGRFKLFVVPGSGARAATSFTAIINRI